MSGVQSHATSARAARDAVARGATTHRTPRGSASTLAGILRRLAALLAALAVCATVAGLWQASLASAAVDAAASACAVRGGDQLRALGANDDAPHPELVAAVVDDEPGDDGELGADVTDAVASPRHPFVAPLAPNRAWPDDPSIARSRLATGAALPRGPPAHRA